MGLISLSGACFCYMYQIKGPLLYWFQWFLQGKERSDERRQANQKPPIAISLNFGDCNGQ